MFDLGWTELLVIGVVALIVVGPKELPMLFRKVGQFVGRAKGMAREFTRAMDQAADQSGIKEATDSFKGMASAKDMGLDDLKKSTEDLKNWSPESETGKLAAERAEAAKKIHEATAKKQADKRAAEDAAKAEAAAAAKVKDAATPADAAKDAPDTEDKA